MKFHNFDILYKCCYIFDDLSSALACRVESIKVRSAIFEECCRIERLTSLGLIYSQVS